MGRSRRVAWPGGRSPERYRLVNHVCRCGGRLLKPVGEQTNYRCSDCGRRDELTKLCWCGYGTSDSDNGYRCLPVAMAHDMNLSPAIREHLQRALGACGYHAGDDPEYSRRVGMVLYRDYKALQEAGMPDPAFIHGSVTWALDDHMCRDCQGRVLQSVAGAGMTGGGNPIYSCATCGRGGASMGPTQCWCAHEWRTHPGGGHFVCVPLHAVEQHPELEAALRMNGIAIDPLVDGKPSARDANRMGVVSYEVWRMLQKSNAPINGLNPTLTPKDAPGA